MAKNFCQNCGTKIESTEYAFCTNCGASLRGEAQVAAPGQGLPPQGDDAAQGGTMAPAARPSLLEGEAAGVKPAAQQKPAPQARQEVHSGAPTPQKTAPAAARQAGVPTEIPPASSEPAQKQLTAVEQDLQNLFDAAQIAPAKTPVAPIKEGATPPLQQPLPGIHAAPAQRPVPATPEERRPAPVAAQPTPVKTAQQVTSAKAAQQPVQAPANPPAAPVQQVAAPVAQPKPTEAQPVQRPRANTQSIPVMQPAGAQPPAQNALPPAPRENLFDAPPSSGTPQHAAGRNKPSVTAIFNASQTAVNTAAMPPVAEEAPGPAGRRRAQREAKPTPRFDDYPAPKRGPSAAKIVVIALLVLVLAVGATAGVMLFINRPGAAIDTFTAALEQKDIPALQQNVALASGLTASEGDWQALCAAFEEQGSRNQLRSQLNNQEGASAAADAPYPSITVQSEPLFLFINRHYILLQPVEVFVPAAIQGANLVMNAAVYEGTHTGEGMTYPGIMPGRYLAEIYYNGAPVPGTVQQQIDVFAVAQPTVFTGLGDGTTTPPQPDPENPVSAPASSGAAQTPEEVAAALTEQEINTVLAEFYNAYLACLNTQDISGMRSTTQRGTQTVQERMAMPSNQDSVFEYVSAGCDAQSITPGQEGGQPAVWFNAAFQFAYTPRDGSAEKTQGSNYQSVQMVYEDNAWKVNQFIYVSDADYEAHSVAAAGA